VTPFHVDNNGNGNCILINFNGISPNVSRYDGFEYIIIDNVSCILFIWL